MRSIFKEIEESQTLLINTQSKLLIDQNKKVIKFGFGQSMVLSSYGRHHLLTNRCDSTS